MTLVAKKLRMPLRKPKAAADQPFFRRGVTRMGTVGVEFVHQGTKGWGASDEAARAAWQQNRAMTNGHVGKNSWEVPMDHFEPPTPRKRPNYRDGSGNVVGKRMTGAVTGVAKPKKVQPTRVAARSASASTPKSGAMPFVNGRQLSPNDVGKRDRRYNPEAGRQRRLGLATAATGIGGATAIGSGIRSARADTAALRGIDPGVVHVPAEPSKPRTQRRGEGGKMERLSPEEHAAEQKDYNERVGHRTRRLETRSGLERARAAGERGAVVSRHSGGRFALGAGLLAASGGLAHYGRSRSNREWR